MNVIQNLVSPSLYYCKCPYAMNPTRIVVHNTANDASARNEIQYMINNKNEVSFHYAVDDKEIIQGIPENRNAWHSGDGGNGVGNRQGIAIEICYSKSGGARFDAAEVLAAKFIASKLKEKGWGIAQVTKHQDYSNKYCPHRTLDKGWQRFLNMVQAELNALNGQTSKPAVQNGALESYNGFVEITYSGADGITLHSTASWSDSTAAGVVKKGEVFTVVGRQLVDGVYMYKLKSGKWITSAKEYVSFRTTLHGSTTQTTQAPKPAQPTCKYGVGTRVCTNTLSNDSAGSKVYKGEWSGRITRVIPGAKFPYLLNNGTGWTNDTGIDTDPNIPR